MAQSKGRRKDFQNYKQDACVVATATEKTVALALRQIQEEEALSKDLEAQLQRAMAANNASDVELLSYRLSRRQAGTDKLRSALPKVGDQKVIAWSRDERSAQHIIDNNADVGFLAHQGYDLSVKSAAQMAS